MAFNLKIIDLRSIGVIAQTCSLSRSSEILGISQPNLSRVITIIEENIGLKIFDRSVRPLRLTDFGKELIPYITTHINSYSVLVDFVEHYKKSPAGNVRLHAPIGQLIFISKYVMPKLQHNYPELKVELITSNLLSSEYSEGASFSVGCDILFTHTLPKSDELVAEKIVPMQLNVYGEKKFIHNHPVSTLKDYSQYPCILFSSFMEGGINTWNFFDKKYNKEVSVFVNGSYVCDNACTALELARSGIGYIYVPDMLIHEMGCTELLLPTLPRRYSSSLMNYMIYRRRSYQPYRVEVVIRLIKEIIANIINDFNSSIHLP